MRFKYYASYDDPRHAPEHVAQVLHTCGHAVLYRYGGTSEYFLLPRKEFQASARRRVCPSCQVVRDLPLLNTPLSSPFPVAGGELVEIEKKIVFRATSPVILQNGDQEHRYLNSPAPIEYTYATRILGPHDASYLHRAEGHEYTEEELAWFDEFVVQSRMSDAPHYAPGRTLSTWAQIEEQERRTGQPMYFA